MTLFLLGAIFCVLVVIVRELRLLRKGQLHRSPTEQQSPANYKPRTFTFFRSGWTLRLVDLDEWVGTIAAVVIWWKFVLPLLPSEPWVKYSITAVGLLACGFVAIMVVGLLDPLHRWMDKYDERVLKRVFTSEELDYLHSPHTDSSERDHMYKQKGI